ncbi:Multi antimicrobial extrusion (MATE) family transporter [Streptococcus sp. DD10]|uniref:MATE family efflux transporter n=1 Tax=Streptococcus sp. DD10 TaxID=1777878 RepID=UPI000799017E|nr:MATE family efflux transporter [Streptococcus sp. DD10]KXT74824.1 Multi antimicrobial extrusion (MATE) family transporter [Streptococcus sp. DD10]
MFQNQKEILRIALPAMGENFLQMLMGMVDGYLVAHLGIIAISGVSVAGNIITIYQAVFIALGAAVASLLSRSLGQRDNDSLAHYARESIKVTLLLSLLLGVFSALGGHAILNFLGTEAAVADAGALYLTLVGGTTVLLGLTMTLGTLIRVTRNPRLPMCVSILSNVLNLVFSSFAIYGLKLGIAGVAWGTILARLVGVVILWRQVDITLLEFDKGLDRKLLALALPAAGERLLMRAGDVVIVAIIVAFGTEIVAGNAVGETLTQFNYMPALGVATATVMLVAHSVGMQDWQEVEKLTKQSYWISLAFMFPIGLTILLLGQPLTQLYTSDAGAIGASLTVILYSAFCMPLTAGTLVYTALWQGMGNARLPFMATAIGMWFIRIVAGYLMGLPLGMGLAGVWAATLLDNAFRYLLLSYLYRRKIQKERTL